MCTKDILENVYMYTIKKYIYESTYVNMYKIKKQKEQKDCTKLK